MRYMAIGLSVGSVVVLVLVGFITVSQNIEYDKQCVTCPKKNSSFLQDFDWGFFSR